MDTATEREISAPGQAETAAKREAADSEAAQSAAEREAPASEEAETICPIPDESSPGEESTEKAALPKWVRPELIMGLIAIVSAALLLVMVVLCIPYFNPDEDPEPLARHNSVTESVQETILEPTIPETEPENPTIPPDPNPYDRYDFQYNRNNYLLLQNLTSYPGVDVSAYQGEIDWEAVASSGIWFAIVRLGYRGYGSGKLVEDSYARRNLNGAKEAGLNVGAYFFSQALNIQEVDEEIQFMLEILDEFHLDMPIVLDWEIPGTDSTPPRTAGMDARTLTDMQLHFCQVMEERGYQPMVYFNWHQSENLYYLSELEDAPFWLALYQDRMTYPWKVEMWQYSNEGSVPGINGYVDLNVYMPDYTSSY